MVPAERYSFLFALQNIQLVSLQVFSNNLQKYIINCSIHEIWIVGLK